MIATMPFWGHAIVAAVVFTLAVLVGWSSNR